MNNLIFLKTVKQWTSDSDFKENEVYLSTTPEYNHYIFLDCLKAGLSISKALKATVSIFEITRTTNLSATEVLKLIPSFDKLNAIMLK